MSVTADRQQFSPISGERRIDVPPKSLHHRAIYWLLRRSHLRNRRRGQHASPAIQQSLRKKRQIIGGGKYSRMTRHAAHPASCRIMHYAAQQVMILILFGGRNAC